VVPTIYEILGITPPKVVDGHEQDPIDGVSFAYTFDSAEAPERKKTQYFEIMGSRGIYHEGWMASTFGPRTPVERGSVGPDGLGPGVRHLAAVRYAQRLLADERSRREESGEARGTQGAVHGGRRGEQGASGRGGLYTGLNPQEMKRSANTEWTLFEGITRIPESEAPNVRNGNLRAEIEAEVPEDVNGVIFAMGGYAGGVSLFAVDGTLYYEYSALLLKRDTIEVGSCRPARCRSRWRCAHPWSARRPRSSSSGSTANRPTAAPCSAPSRPRSPPRRPSTSAWTPAHRSPTPTSTRRRLNSRASSVQLADKVLTMCQE
jgi:hypothetical protein